MKTKIDGHSILLLCLLFLAITLMRLAVGAAWSGLGACSVAVLASLLIFVFDGSRATLVKAKWTEAARSEYRRMTER
jgi:hypothetical protein